MDPIKEKQMNTAKYPEYSDVDNLIAKLWREGKVITSAVILIELEKHPNFKNWNKDWRQVTVYSLNRWKK
jgi:hypothetical protein